MTLPVYAIKAPVFSGVYLTPFHYFLNFVQLPDLSRAPLPGDHMPGAPPVPIPNTAVKPRAANGSRTLGPARVGRCQGYGPILRKKDRASFLQALRNADASELQAGELRIPRPIFLEAREWQASSCYVGANSGRSSGSALDWPSGVGFGITNYPFRPATADLPVNTKLHAKSKSDQTHVRRGRGPWPAVGAHRPDCPIDDR